MEVPYLLLANPLLFVFHEILKIIRLRTEEAFISKVKVEQK